MVLETENFTKESERKMKHLLLMEEQEKLNKIRSIFQSPKMIASMKSCVSVFRKDEEWARTRPPLLDLNEIENDHLVSAMSKAKFNMKF